MKKGLSLFLSLIMVMGVFFSVPITVNAASVDDLNFTLYDEKSYFVTDCDTSASGELVIPDTYKGLPVTGIDEYAFYECKNLNSIIIPNSVTSMGLSAFYGCTSLTSVSIPEHVTTIAKLAFADCINLTSVFMGDEVTFINSSAFSGCTSLNSISIPISVKSIGNYAFSGCINLATIFLPDSVITIGERSFYNTAYYNNENNWENGVLYLGKHLICANKFDENNWNYIGNIKGDYSIKPGTITIASSAFKNCTELTSIIIPDSVMDIGFYAFFNTAYYNNKNNWVNGILYISNHLIEANNEELGASYTVKDGTKTIANSAFYNCTKLVSVAMAKSVACIGESAFLDCENLASVKLSDNLIVIGTKAFSGCGELSEITIPNSVIEISEKAFGYIYSDKIDRFIVYGKKGSAAEIYANKNGFTFIEIKEECVHKFTKWVTDKKATVNSAGSKHKECTECGEILETAKIPQLKCSKPKLKSIENTEYGVLTKWGKVSGADKYDVYRKTGSSGKYSKIGTTSKTYYTDKKASSGKKYYYYVKAVNEAGSSEASNSLSKYYLADTTLSTPKSTRSGVTLRWKKVTGADGYMVYRKTGSGSYSKIATVKGNSKVTYMDKKAKKGKTYTYKVKAYKSKTYSAYSNTKTIKDKY